MLVGESRTERGACRQEINEKRDKGKAGRSIRNGWRKREGQLGTSTFR